MHNYLFKRFRIVKNYNYNNNNNNNKGLNHSDLIKYQKLHELHKTQQKIYPGINYFSALPKHTVYSQAVGEWGVATHSCGIDQSGSQHFHCMFVYAPL